MSIRTLVSTAVRTRSVLLRIPWLASHSVDLRVHVHWGQDPSHSVYRIVRASRLAPDQLTVSGLEVEDLAWAQSELLPQRLGDRHLSFLGNSTLHTRIV